MTADFGHHGERCRSALMPQWAAWPDVLVVLSARLVPFAGDHGVRTGTPVVEGAGCARGHSGDVMAQRFNPPPNWPPPPSGWSPPRGWLPDPAWGPPPTGWPLWVGADANRRANGRNLRVLGSVVAALAIFGAGVIVGGGSGLATPPVATAALSAPTATVTKTAEVAVAQEPRPTVTATATRIVKRRVVKTVTATVTNGSSGGGGGGGSDPMFSYCYEANDAGYGPYYQGSDPEYDWYDDADADGIVCEQ